MSIFRDTFTTEISASLAIRQNAMVDRTPKVIQYLNSRNSWIRLSSSVNINGSADKAKNNVLLGGTLKYDIVNGTGVYSLKQGVGGTGGEAYANKNSLAAATDLYRLGTRPMPGITNMEIKSKSAYGSLREATINFVCWDIKQLEELELLYMRPGYTVLVEWGWLPYLDNKGDLVTSLPNFYDILNKGATARTTIFKQLYDKCTKSGGNYDAMFGYVKNYQWSAREDGGYDCQTTVISTGEIIESLKVNFVLPDLTKLNSTAANGDGFLNDEFSPQGGFPPNKWKGHYERNTLAGVWAEAYDKLKDPGSKFSTGSIFKDNYAMLEFPGLTSINSSDPDSLSGGSNYQVYITLEAMFDVLQKYIVPKDSSGEPLIKLTLDTENYAGSKDPLLCVAHPVQISVDPSVCLIKSPIWYDTKGGILYGVQQAAASSSLVPIKQALEDASNKKSITDFETAIKQIAANDIPTYIAVEGLLGGPGKIEQLLDNILNSGVDESAYSGIVNHLKSILGAANVQTTTSSRTTSSGSRGSRSATVRYTSLDSVKLTVASSGASTSAATAIAGVNQAITNISLLDKLDQPFFSGNANGYDELGIIKNIFVNLNFLYKQALDPNLESADNKEKNEISLYKYLKSIISAIQTSIGNVNNFEIHVDPVDNEARIIDINYTGAKATTSLFKLQVHNLNSVVRRYSLQSQIFPEQSSIIAIGSQAKGGQLGIQNNTMIDFNKNLIDRIIPEKLFPDGNNVPGVNSTTNSTNIASNLGSIVSLFANLSTTPPTPPGGGTSVPTTNAQSVAPTSGIDLNSLFNKAKSNLRDLIVYFQSVTNSPGANRNIIPIKFSFDMDGIGGLVIGHLFEINDDILPNGYKGAGAGSKLAQTVTGIRHNIENGDWVTKIDALNIILGSKSGTPFKNLKLKDLVEQSFKSAFQPVVTGTGGGSVACSSKVILAAAPTTLILVRPTNADDTEIYKEILKGIGAPATDSNILFMYAWRNGESGTAAWNPFNTTQPATGATCYNSAKVRNYPDRATGIAATVKTLLNGNYNGLVSDLKNGNIRAYDIATKHACTELDKWGTGHLVNNVLSYPMTSVKAIARSTTKSQVCP